MESHVQKITPNILYTRRDMNCIIWLLVIPGGGEGEDIEGQAKYKVQQQCTYMDDVRM